MKRMTASTSLLFALVASLAIPARAEDKPAPTDLDRQKSTMAAIRTVATSCEAYAVDNETYPKPAEGYADAETLRPIVQPTYVRDLPATDAWGHPLRYWSDGKHYAVISNGRDGKADGPYEKVTAATKISRFDGDIIFRDGAFIQWPEGAQK